MTLPIVPSTYLANPGAPSFVLGLPPVRVAPFVKPAKGSPMMGPMVEFIRNFWPMWDDTSGTIVEDIAIGQTAEMITSGGVAPPSWGEGKSGQCVLTPQMGDDVAVNSNILLSGAFALDRLVYLGGVWAHWLTNYDNNAGTRVTYKDGVLFSTEPYSDTGDDDGGFVGVTIHSLVAWDYNTPSDVQDIRGVEFARIWERTLESYEAAALAADPYLVFGLTQDVIDEITTIANFMKPMCTNWSIVTVQE